MFFDADNSKEAIKSRMLRVALNYWNLKNVDELDPLVKLMMEALSGELYDVVNDIKTAEGRILEKMAALLAPDLLTMALPAHAVMQALPADSAEMITPEDQFYTEKKLPSRQDGPLDTSIDVYFAPANKARIFDCSVTYFFGAGNLYSYDKNSNKILLAGSNKGSGDYECCVFIGLRVTQNIKDLKGMSFFFDLRNTEASAAESISQYLPHSKWYIGNNEIEVMPGMYDYDSLEKKEESGGIGNTGFMATVVANIQSYYNPKFVTITDDMAISEDLLQPYPDSFKNKFSLPVLSKFEEGLLWLKVVFPVAIKDEWLSTLYTSVNAFPVLNCKKNEIRYRLRGGRHIIPIPNIPNENFLTIKSFTDGDMNYTATPVKKSAEDEVGTYTLRSGGLERFDSRNGREMILYLIELLRSESAAFTVYGQDFIAGTLKEINQFISLLEQRTNTTLTDALEAPNYLIVTPPKGREFMFVEYWTTNTNLANNLRSGAKLQQSSAPPFKIRITGTFNCYPRWKRKTKTW